MRFGDKSGRKKSLLSEEEHWVLNVLDSEEISYTLQEEETMYTLVFSTKPKSMLKNVIFMENQGQIRQHQWVENYGKC